MRASVRFLRAQKGLLVLGLWAVSIVLFILLHQIMGLSATFLTTIPIVLAAYFWGIRKGLLFTTVAIGVSVALAFLLAFTTNEIFLHYGGLFVIPVLFLVAVVAGLLGETTRQHRRETAKTARDLNRSDSHVQFMTTLNEIVRASLEAEDMPSLLQVLTNRTGGLFLADECIVSLLEPSPGFLRPMMAYSSTGANYHIVPGEANQGTLTGCILEAGQALKVEDTRNTYFVDLERTGDFPRLQSILGLPLIAGGKKLGALILGFTQHHSFSDEESERGELAARQISLAMTKVLLLEEAHGRMQEFDGLHKISQAFTLHRDDRRTYGLLTEILAEQLDTKICFICLVDPKTGEVHTQAPAYGLSDELASAFQFPSEIGERIWSLANGQVFQANSPDQIPPEFVSLSSIFGIQCVQIARLQDSENRWFGAVFTANKTEGFEEKDARLMEVLANQVSVVIQNTLLLSDERKRAQELAVLHEVSTTTTAINEEDELIEKAAHLIGERMFPESLDIFLLDKAMGELYLHTSYRDGGQDDSLRVPLGIGITGAVAKLGKARRVGDVSKAPEYLSIHSLTRSELCIPLKVEEQIIGVINAESKTENAFSEQDEELLTILAGQIASAIQRLRTVKAENRQTKELSRSNALIRALAQLGARASAAADPVGVMQTLGNELSALGLRCMIALSDADNQQAVIRYTSLPKQTMKVIERIAGQKINNAVISIDRLTPLSPASQSPSLISDPTALLLQLLPGMSRQTIIKLLKAIGIIETTSVCLLPLVTEGRSIGILWMWGEGLHENDLPAMSLFASQVATALQNAKLLAEVQRLAITDELTQISNRRHFYDLAEVEFSRAKRYNHPLAALIVDIDHFKQFNDHYGHLIGDRVLREVAHALQDSLRESDILGRYGGEEFSILLPVTELKAAVYVAERLLSRVAEAAIQSDAGELHVQLSIGVSCLSKETPTLHALIDRADQAMYMAKDAGRNCVAVK